jgi:hypothetical protein
MKLKEFIKTLKEIYGEVENPEIVEVEMADCIPVVKPILKDNTVFITDVKEKRNRFGPNPIIKKRKKLKLINPKISRRFFD